jgi:hypothetical protein
MTLAPVGAKALDASFRLTNLICCARYSVTGGMEKPPFT